jgi:hypothetical protein
MTIAAPVVGAAIGFVYMLAAKPDDAVKERRSPLYLFFSLAEPLIEICCHHSETLLPVTNSLYSYNS